jgi:predicted transcriptional regulator
MRENRNNITVDANAPPDSLGSRLQHLRCLRDTKQSAVAEVLQIDQTELSRLEERDDIPLSTLVAYVRALGGDLQIAVTFSEHQPVTLLGNADWIPRARENLVNDVDQRRLPSIVDPTRLPPSRDVVFGVRPAHAQRILDGSKTVELRRRFNEDIKPGTLALIYTTRPTSALTGFATIHEVKHLEVDDLWKRYRSSAYLSRVNFEDYFSGLKYGYAIVLESARTLVRPIKLAELRERFGFEPPRFYQYASPGMRSLIEDAAIVSKAGVSRDHEQGPII